MAATAPRDRRRAATRAALLDSAIRHFAEGGYHATTLDRIAEGAGVTKGAVYANFSSKEELFLTVLDRNVDDAVAAFTQLLAVPPAERTAGLAERSAGLAVLDRSWFLLEAEFLLYAARGSEEVRTALTARSRRTHTAIARLVEAHLRDLGVGEATAPAMQVARLMIAAVDGLNQSALADPGRRGDAGALLARLFAALVRDAVD